MRINLKDTFCILAEQGLHLHNSGRCNSCSDSLHYWQDSAGNEMTLADTNLQDIWQSKSRADFLTDLRNGVQHSNCEKCWQKERVGITSKRQTANKDWAEFADLSLETPQYIDLKWGNVCNLKCRHCNPWTSSRWIREWYDIDEKSQQSDYQTYVQQFATTNESYSRNNEDRFHRIFKQWFSQCQHLSLYGGEGMYVPAVLDTLSHAVETGASKKIDLYINTNGSVYSQQWIDTLQQFKNVRMAFSLDGIGDSFEYIRYGAKWHQVVENFRAYQQAGIQTEIVTTVFTHNVYNSMEIVKKLYLELGKVPEVNWVYGPEWLDVRILPGDVKTACLQRINQDWSSMQQILEPGNVDQFTRQYHELINFIPDSVEGSDAKFDQLKKWTRALDKTRDQSFARVFPEYNKYLQI